MEARKQALEADVVVVNHHLFFADVVLRDEGVAELLPACNTVIFDEAHQLPDTASLFFGESVSTSQLIELARDTRIEAAASARDNPALPEAAAALEKSARDLRLQFRDEAGRQPFAAAKAGREFGVALDGVDAGVTALTAVLESQADRSEGLHNCWARAVDILERLAHWQQEDDREWVRWIELFGASVHLNATPLSIADIFRRQVKGHPRAWIFTSATLSVQGNFSHYQREMGLEEATTAFWESPFDYPNQAMLYVPEKLPEPNTEGYTRAAVDAALPVIEAAEGRTFFLFTSLRAMREARELMETGMKRMGMDFPLLMQGEGSRSELLDRFRKLGNAVLLGSASFWEGVDVRGEALQLVIIDRLPFSPPDDPVLAARSRNERRRAQRLHGIPAAAGGDHSQAGRRPVDPGRERSRRADDLRPAADHQALRQAHLAQPAAYEANPRCRGSDRVLPPDRQGPGGLAGNHRRPHHDPRGPGQQHPDEDHERRPEPAVRLRLAGIEPLAGFFA
jgi:ATP-dependent DNA helicase DinG